MVSVRVERGDVVIVELDPTRGAEQRGTRPCLVVQNDAGNRNAPTTIVVPFTTSGVDGETYPFEVRVGNDESPLREDSLAMCSQLRTVSIEGRIRENVGSIPDARLAEVERALEYSLGLVAPSDRSD